MFRRRCDWLPMAFGGILGAYAGLLAAGQTVWAVDWELVPVNYKLTYSQPPQPGVDAVFEVEVLGIWRYTRTAPDPSAFAFQRAAYDALGDLPGVVMVVVGLTVGVLSVRYTSRWLQKRRADSSRMATQSTKAKTENE